MSFALPFSLLVDGSVGSQPYIHEYTQITKQKNILKYTNLAIWTINPNRTETYLGCYELDSEQRLDNKLIDEGCIYRH